MRPTTSRTVRLLLLVACVLFLGVGSFATSAMATATSSISGTVTDAGGPVAGESVTAWHLEDGAWVSEVTVQTGPAGQYTLSGLEGGDYVLHFRDPSRDHADQFYTDVKSPSPYDERNEVLHVTPGAAAGFVDTELAAGGSVSGHVTDEAGGAPLQGVTVESFVWAETHIGSWESYSTTQTDAAGAYTLRGLPAGPVRVRFRDASLHYLTEMYADIQTFDANSASCTAVPVTSGGATTGVDAQLVADPRLATLGAIEGTVTAAGVGGLTGVTVELFSSQSGGWAYAGKSSVTTASGGYRLASVTPGTYRMRFSSSVGAYLTECYDDVAGADVADSACATVTVGDSETVRGISAELVPAARITGTVTGSDGGPLLEGIEVTAYLLDQTTGSWDVATGGYTDGDGVYSLAGLAGGIYRLYFDDPSFAYLPEYFDDVHATSVDDPAVTSIVATAGALIAGRDAVLAAPSGPGQFPDAFEPDDSKAAARLAESSVTETHTLYPEGDADWIRVAGEAGTTYSFQTTETIVTDTYIEIYDAADTLVASNDDIDDSGASLASYTPGADGDFYVRIRGAMPSSTGPYTLNMTIPEGTPPPTVRPTFLSISATPTVLTAFGAPVTLSGVLRVDSVSGDGLVGESVSVQASADGSSGWSTVQTVTSGAGGAVSCTIVPSSKTYYRLAYAGQTDVYSASASTSTAQVVPRAYVGNVSVTRKGTRTYDLKGYLKPRHAAGTYPVRIYRWKLVSGTWRSYGYVKAKAYNYSAYTRYLIRYRFPSTGTWRLRAYHPADSGHPAGWSPSYYSFRVR